MVAEQLSNIMFTLPGGKTLDLKTAHGVFTPTGTTTLLIDAVEKSVRERSAILDLGCGTGVVGIALALHGLAEEPVHASDLSSSAVSCSKDNFEAYGVKADIRHGSLFEPWGEEKFDVIVDDISGVAQDVAIISPWFKGVPAETGRDGTDLVVNILSKAPQHLKAGGKLFFPVLSLSNVDVLLESARESFRKVELISKLEWPLPPELKPHVPLLRKLAAEGNIKLQEKFGMVLCYTEVYCASAN